MAGLWRQLFSVCSIPRKTAWTRWGRGDCEGYTFRLGCVRGLHGNVVRKATGLGEPEAWRGTIDCYEKIFPDRESAMAYVEHEIQAAMKEVLVDWNAYCTLKGNTY